MTKNLSSLRKLILNGFDLMYSLVIQESKIIDIYKNVIVKTGGFNGRFWYLNAEPKKCDNLNSVECLVNDCLNEIEIEDEHSYPINNALVDHHDHNYARKE